MTNTTHAPAPVKVYPVRCKGSDRLEKALKKEQAQRQLDTGKRIPLMDIAEEWLEEKAAQYDC